MKLNPNEQNPLETRRNMLNKSLSMILFQLVFFKNPSEAAIPTMDDYYSTTTGAQIKSTSTTTTSIADRLSQKSTFSSDMTVDPIVAFLFLVDQAILSLEACKELVDKGDYASLRTVLRGERGTIYEKNVLSTVRKKYFGIEEKTFVKAFGSSNAKKIEDGRNDISIALSLLEDFALSNRSIFFNSVDKKQVEELIAETGFEENLSEGKELWESAYESTKLYKKNLQLVLVTK